jgi:ABC-type siderophore export system fused ATPase/permease subunit
MMNTKNDGSSLTGILLVVFIVLKLTNLINWSWLWVLSPLWIPVSIVVILVSLTALLVLIMEAFKRW